MGQVKSDLVLETVTVDGLAAGACCTHARVYRHKESTVREREREGREGGRERRETVAGGEVATLAHETWNDTVEARAGIAKSWLSSAPANAMKSLYRRAVN